MQVLGIHRSAALVDLEHDERVEDCSPGAIGVRWRTAGRTSRRHVTTLHGRLGERVLASPDGAAGTPAVSAVAGDAYVVGSGRCSRLSRR